MSAVTSGHATAATTPLVYVANQNGTVTAYDAATGMVAATIQDGDGPQQVAVSPDGKTAYVLNSAGTVSVISTVTNTVTATIGVGNGPVGVAVTPDGKTAYVANGGDGAWCGRAAAGSCGVPELGYLS